jgi:long-chain acyl-CoA synthetase
MLAGESLADILTVGDITRHHAKNSPDRVAIHFEGQHTTYGELDRRANRVANGLVADGLRPQGRIAYLAKNSPAFFDLWFGRRRAGAGQFPPCAA